MCHVLSEGASSRERFTSLSGQLAAVPVSLPWGNPSLPLNDPCRLVCRFQGHSNILRQVEKPSISFLLICFMEISEARKMLNGKNTTGSINLLPTTGRAQFTLLFSGVRASPWRSLPRWHATPPAPGPCEPPWYLHRAL